MRQLPPSICPQCGSRLNVAAIAATVADSIDVDAGLEARLDAGPKPDDITVCAYCVAVLVFCDDLSVRAITAAEVAEFPTEALLVIDAAQRMVYRALARRQQALKATLN